MWNKQSPNPMVGNSALTRPPFASSAKLQATKVDEPFTRQVASWTNRFQFAHYAKSVVHKDMRSHTGALLTLGQGALVSMSFKHKPTSRLQLRPS
jgi:hypothetical protein